MPQQALGLSILIVSYKRLDDLAECIGSVHSKISGRIDYEIIVVDNASSAECKGLCERRGVTYVDSGANRGVAGGRNVAIAAATGGTLFFIDDDAVVDTVDFDVKVSDALAPGVGAVAVQVLSYARRTPNRGELPFRRKKGVSITDSRLVSYFVGAGFAVRKEVFEQVGLLREDFFYGGEELEFSLRLLLKNWAIKYCPAVLVLHKKSNVRSTVESQYYHILRNRFVIACNLLPWPYSVSHLLIWTSVLLPLALKDKAISQWYVGLKEGIHYWREHRKHGEVVSAEVIKYLKAHEGRLWF